MRAAWYEAQGPAREVLRVGTLAEPHPGAGEVRVRIAVSAVNPVDVKRRRGGRGAMEAPRVIPHFDGAGVIDEVGEGVDPLRVGERVWVFEAQWQRAAGTAAQWVVLPARLAVPLPGPGGGPDDEAGRTAAVARPASSARSGDGVGAGAPSLDRRLLAGACLGIPGLTAYQCVFGDGAVTGQLVLVTGAAGGVGNYAVQFAKLGGATVVGTVSGEEKAERALRAGADHVLDYRRQQVADEIDRLAGGAGVDRVVDVAFAANMETSLAVLKPGGTLSTYASDLQPEPVLPFYRFMYRAVRVHFELVFLMPPRVQQRALVDIGRWLQEDRLVHQPGKTFPLSEIAAAHESVEAGGDGRRVLVLPWELA